MKERHGGNIHKYIEEAGAGKESPLDFSANLNPLGMPEKGRDVLRRLSLAAEGSSPEDRDFWNITVEAYPDPEQKELTGAIAESLAAGSGAGLIRGGTAGLEERIVCGNGAADIIERLPGALSVKSALIVCPAFIEYEESLEKAGSRIERYFLRAENGFRFEEGILGRIRKGDESGRPYDAVYICNPQNPTGVLFKAEEMKAAAGECAKAGSILIADECFMDFVESPEMHTLLPLIDGGAGAGEASPRIIILGSFTKMFAMAGLRLGYCVCSSADDAEKIRKEGQAWPVSSVAAKVGTALAEETAFIEETVRTIRSWREAMKSQLTDLGCKVYDSRANYIFFETGLVQKGPGLVEKLREKGIMIKDCGGYEGLGPGCYRAAVRTPGENERLITELRRIRDENCGTEIATER